MGFPTVARTFILVLLFSFTDNTAANSITPSVPSYLFSGLIFPIVAHATTSSAQLGQGDGGEIQEPLNIKQVPPIGFRKTKQSALKVIDKLRREVQWQSARLTAIQAKSLDKILRSVYGDETTWGNNELFLSMIAPFEFGFFFVNPKKLRLYEGWRKKPQAILHLVSIGTNLVTIPLAIIGKLIFVLGFASVSVLELFPYPEE